jgi:hypothetical protein
VGATDPALQRLSCLHISFNAGAIIVMPTGQRGLTLDKSNLLLNEETSVNFDASLHIVLMLGHPAERSRVSVFERPNMPTIKRFSDLFFGHGPPKWLPLLAALPSREAIEHGPGRGAQLP